MTGSVPLAFADWQTFYMMVGSSGGALIGLQFVVITLIAQSSIKSSHAQLGAFGTPQLVHFGAALGVSAIMDAPWRGLYAPAVGLGICGFVGLVFVGLVVRRTRRQRDYKLVWEDWLWHALVPLTLYTALSIAAFMLPSHPDSMFVIAAAALSLVFTGIRNAWDTVTFIVVERMPDAAPAVPAKKKGGRR
jgi:hypothetical protein